MVSLHAKVAERQQHSLLGSMQNSRDRDDDILSSSQSERTGPLSGAIVRKRCLTAVGDVLILQLQSLRLFSYLHSDRICWPTARERSDKTAPVKESVAQPLVLRLHPLRPPRVIQHLRPKSSLTTKTNTKMLRQKRLQPMSS